MNLRTAFNGLPFAADILDAHMLEVVKGASVAFVLKVFGAGFAFAFNVVLARMLGAGGSGVYYLALTLATIVAVFGTMGLDNALLRFVAAGAAVDDWASVKGVYRKAVTFAAGAAVASGLVLFMLAPWLATAVLSKPETEEPLRWMAAAVVPMVLLTLHAEALKGIKRIRDSQLVQAAGTPIFSLVALYFFGQSWGVKGAVWAYTLAVTLTGVLAYGIWRIATPKLRDVKGRFDTRRLLCSATPLFWIAFTNLVMVWCSTLLLGILRPSEDVGVFGIASRTASLMGYVLIAVNSIAAPKFAALHRLGDMEALGSTARKSARLMILIVSPLCALFILAPTFVMGLFGPQFGEGGVALSILAAGQLINVAAGSVGYLLMMSGNGHLLRNGVLVSAVINVLLCILLIPRHGFIGAAIASAMSLAVLNIICLILVRNSMGINMLKPVFISQRRV
ncbi:flippase [Candidatus Poribacteria bacterium]|nr:flippase [Candidatus Poribacteria bacterium]